MPQLHREDEIGDVEETVLRTLPERDGLQIQEISELLDMEFQEAKEAVNELSKKSLVFSGPDFQFEADKSARKILS